MPGLPPKTLGQRMHDETPHLSLRTRQAASEAHGQLAFALAELTRMEAGQRQWEEAVEKRGAGVDRRLQVSIDVQV